MQSPSPCPPTSEPITGRRRFLRVMTAGLGTVAGAILGIPIVGYFFGQRKREAHWVTLGDVASFPLNETRLIDFDNPFRQPWDGVASLTGVFVRNEGQGSQGANQFLVLSVHCAHLGCPVSWFPQSGLFMCPCHGGVYYSNGDHASGPPPRGMFHCDWRVQDGQLQVRAPHYPTLHDTLKEPV
jgi:menaquinol-cytochrome c reductase iron-sulfur subunit